MKRPNPTFLKKAEGIKTSRKKRTLVIILILLAITFVVVFISSIASAQDTYRLMYPGLVGAATSTTTAYSAYQRPVHTTTETTTEVTTTMTTTQPHAVLAATPTPTISPEGDKTSTSRMQKLCFLLRRSLISQTILLKSAAKVKHFFGLCKFYDDFFVRHEENNYLCTMIYPQNFETKIG